MNLYIDNRWRHAGLCWDSPMTLTKLERLAGSKEDIVVPQSIRNSNIGIGIKLVWGQTKHPISRQTLSWEAGSGHLLENIHEVFFRWASLVYLSLPAIFSRAWTPCSQPASENASSNPSCCWGFFSPAWWCNNCHSLSTHWCKPCSFTHHSTPASGKHLKNVHIK